MQTKTTATPCYKGGAQGNASRRTKALGHQDQNDSVLWDDALSSEVWGYQPQASMSSHIPQRNWCQTCQTASSGNTLKLPICFTLHCIKQSARVSSRIGFHGPCELHKGHVRLGSHVPSQPFDLVVVNPVGSCRHADQMNMHDDRNKQTQRKHNTQLKRDRQQRTHAEHNDQDTTTNNPTKIQHESHVTKRRKCKGSMGTESLPRLQHRWQRRPNYHNGDIALISRKSGMRVGTFNASFALLRLRRRLRHIHHGLGAGEPSQAAGHALGWYSSKTVEESPAKRHLSFCSVCLALLQHLVLPLLC